jgi:hypothetical protein
MKSVLGNLYRFLESRCELDIGEEISTDYDSNMTSFRQSE